LEEQQTESRGLKNWTSKSVYWGSEGPNSGDFVGNTNVAYISTTKLW